MKGKANRMGVEEGVPAHDLRWTTRRRKAALKKMLTPAISIHLAIRGPDGLQSQKETVSLEFLSG